MNSMTGFGKAEHSSKIGKFVIEISSVNNRYLEISPRLPRGFFSLESKIRELVTSKVNRGKINIFINFEEQVDETGKVLINKSVTKAVYGQLSKLQKELKIPGQVTINDMLLIPDVIKPEISPINEKLLWKNLEAVLLKALNALVVMRKKEGSAISKDMKKRIAILDKGMKDIEKLASKSVGNYRDKLTQKVQELIADTKKDSIRIEEEIAILAERTDITEECTRFHSHLSQYKSTIAEQNPIGKKLNFILQELNREANTIASKCSDIDISTKVITIKEEIEKLREQVQNIE